MKIKKPRCPMCRLNDEKIKKKRFEEFFERAFKAAQKADKIRKSLDEKYSSSKQKIKYYNQILIKILKKDKKSRQKSLMRQQEYYKFRIWCKNLNENFYKKINVHNI